MQSLSSRTHCKRGLFLLEFGVWTVLLVAVQEDVINCLLSWGETSQDRLSLFLKSE